MKSFLKRFYLVLILIFMYAPILTLVVLSFNQSKSRNKWGGFTFSWYSELFKNESIMTSLYTTLIIALLSALIATFIGTAGAIGMNAMNRRARALFTGITNIPMLNADIVTGISMMLLFIACRFTLGFSTILLAHITFNIPYVILSVLPKLKQTNNSTYEAALDLGASPMYAIRKVVFPDILPGVISGFLLAFTMSLDDFIITYFCKGPGIDTLSTKIYAETRKGIKPEMYALSTLLFLVVLLLLILINLSPDKEDRCVTGRVISAGRQRFNKIMRIFTRRVLPVAVILAAIFGGIYYGTMQSSQSNNQLIVYNWGEYLDPSLIEQFENETGIQVIYEEFETNEVMYPKIKSGAIAYDLACPSDYMIQRMLEEDLLDKINLENIPNYKYLDENSLTMSKEFDPTLEYSVPYLWGTVGILYNKEMVDEPITSWSCLWNEKYADSILMQDSVRDAFMVPLKLSGYSLNSTDLDELREATDMLIQQKPLVQAYVVDQVRDKMIGDEAALGVIYSGEAMICMTANENLDYVVPDEGSNVWIDSWVIPKCANHKENAEKFLNFLLRPESGMVNFEYIGYAVPNEGTRELIEEAEIPYSDVPFPKQDVVENCETYSFLGDKFDRIYNELWREVKSK